MTGRPRSASDEAIFEAMAAVVTAVGPSRLTLTAVAGRVGLSAPALTQRFGSKQGLLAAFAAREAAAVGGALAAARAGAADPVRALVTVLAALPGAAATREGVANNLAFLQMDLTDPELRPDAVAHSRALRDGTAALGNRRRPGLLTPDTIPGALAADLWAAYCGAMLTWAIDGTDALPDWIAGHLERILAPYRTDAKETTPDSPADRPGTGGCLSRNSTAAMTRGFPALHANRAPLATALPGGHQNRKRVRPPGSAAKVTTAERGQCGTRSTAVVLATGR